MYVIPAEEPESKKYEDPASSAGWQTEIKGNWGIIQRIKGNIWKYYSENVREEITK